jgi:hypothetical protein
MNAKHIQVIGTTPEGLQVWNNVFQLYGTLGLPLDMVFQLLQERNAIPSWIHFYDDALATGMRFSRIIAMIRDPLLDCWGKEFQTEILTTLHKIYAPEADSTATSPDE